MRLSVMYFKERRPRPCIKVAISGALEELDGPQEIRDLLLPLGIL
jgi:hypothetical protein